MLTDTRAFYGLNWPALWRDDLRTRPACELHMTRLGEVLLEASSTWRRGGWSMSLRRAI